MTLEYRWIKNDNGALDPEFVRLVAAECEIEAFIETGTYLGDTLAGMVPYFNKLISVELSPTFSEAARARFADVPSVEIIEADSTAGLAVALERVEGQSAFIWLDAHYSGGHTAKGNTNTPIMGELKQLALKRRMGDVILIDDVRYFWPQSQHGFAKHESLADYPELNVVVEALQAISDYEIVFIGDALLALPKASSSGIGISEVLAACTRMRLTPFGSSVNMKDCAAIAMARGAEREALLNLSETIVGQSSYGLGGHYFLWRGLVREAVGDRAQAHEDFAFAERCGVAKPS